MSSRSRHGLVYIGLAGVFALVLTGVLWVGTSLMERYSSRLVADQAEQAALGWAQFIAAKLDRIEEIAQTGETTAEERTFLENARTFGNVFRFKLFSPEGHIKLISDDLNVPVDRVLDLSKHNPKAAQVTETGIPFTEVADGSQKPNRPDVYAESYVPVIQGGKTVAIVEVYVDEAKEAAVLRETFGRFGFEVAGGTVLALAIPFILLFLLVRTLQRQNTILDEERLKAQRADRSKSEFLANMSHEIRTPLNGILGMADVMQRTSLSDQQRNFLNIIMKSGTSLMTIINDILDFSKIDANQVVLDIQPFDIKALAEDVAALISPRVDEKNLELAVRIQPFLPQSVLGDAGRIRQVLTNFMSNAAKFTDHGHILVDVSGKVRDGLVDIVIKVEDTGIGIPEDKLDAVFEKFNQVDNSSTRSHEGTGLGLAICRSLIELMNGEIGVESVMGQGSTFWFSISLPIHAGAAAPRRVPIDVSGSRVLIVDDNEVNRTILLEQLGGWRFDTQSASSGKEALAMLRHSMNKGRQFDLIITDHQMPQMDGEEFSRFVREELALTETPIIMLTSIGQPSCPERLREAGVDGYLVKPARSSMLFDEIVTCLSTIADDVEQAPVAPATPAPSPEPQTSPDPKPSSEGRSGCKILIVEDNETNQLVISELLKELGHSFTTASSGEEALSVIGDYKPDIVLMDVAMPGMGGLEATQRIREIESTMGGRVPIIGVTAHSLTGDREKCLEAGMDDYMPKPVSRSILMTKINYWSAKKKDLRKTA